MDRDQLKKTRDSLQAGQKVKAGETIAIMGRTANTRQAITKDRAHLHFELTLVINDRFAGWYKEHFDRPTKRSRHVEWPKPRCA